VRYTRNNRVEARGNWAGEVNGVRPVGNFLYRINDGVTYDHVYTMNPSSLLNVRAGWQRFQEPNIRQHQGFDPASLGFPSSVASEFGGAQYMPRFDFDSLSDFGDNLGGDTTHSIYSFQPTVTQMFGRHSVRAGYDLRLYEEDSVNPNRQAGQYDFRSNFTRAQDNAAGLFGQDIASFMLGIPTGGAIDRNAGRLNHTWYHGLFIQDDWKLSDRLTLNLGLRYEYEGATTDSDDRNARGFDPAAAVSIAAAARAAYAAAPIPELPVSQFDVAGGIQFAGGGSSGFWNADGNNIQPRVGFAYQLDDRSVLRGGWGIYTVPFIISGVYQPGFSQATSIVPTLDNGLTIRATLANPYPDGVQEPPGATLGADTFLGQNVSRFAPLDFDNAQNMRYTIGVQRELPNQWLVEGSYVGSRGWDLTTNIDVNNVPVEYLSTSPQRDQATINFLTQQVANPFRGLIPGTGFNGATIQRQQLLRPFPHFGNVQTNNDDGTSTYHSAQFKVEKRFTRGYTVLAAYTWSSFKERTNLLNPTDTVYEERFSNFDVPHRFVISGIWELPFGRGRRYAGDAVGLTNALIGGWSVQAIGQLQSGRPIDFGNVYFNGDPDSLKTDYSGDTNDPVFDTSGFYFHDAAVQTNGVDDPAKQRNDQRIRLANNVRYFPSRPANVRGQGLHLWDISIVKRVEFTDRVRMQFHVEFLNAFNHPVFNNPTTDPTNANFGKVTSQNNLPRDIQLAAKIVF
ncbi:MAG TPA: TonB-dependent receptor, partial [Vicinamibacterales bacterium]|nr:TonB-dependent receptor [Vicinamibacterales bacterium]